jgi:hypothetical protein
MLDTASSKSVSEGEGNDIPTHSDDRHGAAKSSPADQETLLIETQPDEKDTAKEKRMKTDSFLNDKKEFNI